MKAAACGRKFNKNFTFLSGRNQLLCFHMLKASWLGEVLSIVTYIYIYIYIYSFSFYLKKSQQSVSSVYRNHQVVNNFEIVGCFYAIERMCGMRVGETMLRRNNACLGH